jgi:hypothetical protein
MREFLVDFKAKSNSKDIYSFKRNPLSETPPGSLVKLQ